MRTTGRLLVATLLLSAAAAPSSDVDDDRHTQPAQGTPGTCTASSGNSYHRHTQPMEDPRISRLLGDQRKAERMKTMDLSIVKSLNCATGLRCLAAALPASRHHLVLIAQPARTMRCAPLATAVGGRATG